MEILVLARFSRSVQSKDVNWLPWRRMAARTSGATMLHIHDFGRAKLMDRLGQGLEAKVGLPLAMALEPVADHGSMLEMRQARTFRLNQSMPYGD